MWGGGYAPYGGKGAGWGKGKGKGFGKGPPAPREVPEEKLRAVGEAMATIVANCPAGLRTAQVPPLLVARGIDLKEIAKLGGLKSQKEVLMKSSEVGGERLFDARPDPKQPGDHVFFPAGKGDEGIEEFARGGGLNAKERKKQEKTQAWKSRQMGTPWERARRREPLSGAEGRELAEQIADCIAAADIKLTKNGLRLSQLPGLMQGRHCVNMKDIKEQRGYTTIRALIQDLPSGYFKTTVDPASPTSDILLWSKDGPPPAASAPDTIPAPTAGAAAAAAPASAAEWVRIACPHCQAELELQLTPGETYQCPTCSGNFNLEAQE
eukprot:TRINITY_DN70333_c0_g1_i1.p2 TRINITY_DN70333_c0_g1~~TRINITY_DN70333_c0_g1_i1.p2  ORF type:complete len:323 (+),score=112.89 TRINITY_DN70333_c0_g1_i1:72-1040(+)